jgi:hypothetical protein
LTARPLGLVAGAFAAHGPLLVQPACFLLQLPKGRDGDGDLVGARASSSVRSTKVSTGKARTSWHSGPALRSRSARQQ